MKKPAIVICFPLLYLVVFVALVSGCSGPIKPSIPKDISAIAPDSARIVLTREDQLAGAGSPNVILDIGENVEANAMLHSKDYAPEEILKTESDESRVSLTADRIWLWFNAEKINPLFCGEHKPGCIVYHWHWPKRENGQLLYGAVLNARDSCELELAFPLQPGDYEAIRRGEIEPVELTGLSECEKVVFTSNKRVLSLIPFLDNFIVGWMFEDYLAKNARGYRFPDVDGYIQLVNFVARRSEFPHPTEYYPESIDYNKLSRNVQLLGSVEVGDTLIWDRRPGIMRLGSAWYDGIDFMSKNIHVEAGKTYFIRYTTRMGQRWELEKVE